MQPLILTNIGLAKLASATPEDQLEIKHIAVGDGGGGYPPIDPTMTALVNEVWRGDSSAPIRDLESNRVLIFETIIPNNEGGFTIREVGLFDVDGDMIAIGQIDEIEKTDGSPGTTPVMLTLRVRLTLENASQTDLIIADSPIVDHQGTSNRDASDAHPIEAITGLRGELDAKANTADLGQGAFFDEATVIQAQVLTAGNRVMTPRRMADALNAQSWQHVTAQRAMDTVYTNTTGRPIIVAATIYVLSGETSATWALRVGPQSRTIASVSQAVASPDDRWTLSGVVPNGWSYSVDNMGVSGFGDVYTWMEYR